MARARFEAGKICFISATARRIRVKIALNVVRASKLVQMKLVTKRSKLGWGAFRKFSDFVLTPIWLPQTRHFTEEEILENVFTQLHELSVTIYKSSQNSAKMTLEPYRLDESWLRYLTWKIHQNC